jgi:uncharacterized membrane protein
MTSEPATDLEREPEPALAEAAPPAPVRHLYAPRGAPAGPPDWVLIGLGLAYIVAIAALVLLPGASLLERLRELDAGICAQVPAHSFFPAGQQLPLCSRNTGIYVGFGATLLTLIASGRLRAARLPVPWVALVLGIAVLGLAVDGFNSLFLDLGLPHLYQPHNLLRLATGLGTGTAMASFLLPVAGGVIWRDDDSRASFGSFRQLAVMLPILVVAFLVVASQAPWILYPVALFSSASLVVALALINLVFAVGLTRRPNQYAGVRHLLPLFTLVVALAIIELIALSVLKTSALRALGVTTLNMP